MPLRSRRAHTFLLLTATLLLAGSARAIPLDLFLSPGDDGQPATSPIALAQPELLALPLWVDPSVAPGSGVFGVQDVRIATFGGVEITSFQCEAAASCLQGVVSDPQQEVLLTAGDDLAGEFSSFRLGQLEILVTGSGGLRLAAGTTLDGSFDSGPLDLATIALFSVPEPGATPLLVAGLLALTGLARARRRAVAASSLVAFTASSVVVAALTASVLGVAGPARAQTYPSPAFDFAGDPFDTRPGRLNESFGVRTTPVPMLVVVLRNAGVDHSAWPAAAIADRVFGAAFGCTPSMERWFALASRGGIDLAPATESQGTPDDGIVLIDGVDLGDASGSEARRIALEEADPFVDYSLFDANGDGQLQNDELVVIAVNGNNADQGGQDGGPNDTSSLDGVGFGGYSMPIVDGMPGSIMTWIHETTHTLFQHRDLYGYGVGRFGVMGPTTGSGDAAWGPLGWTRGILGWADFDVVSQDGRYTLRPGDDSLLLYDPAHGTQEYFTLENRVNGLCRSLDLNAADSGLMLARIVPERLYARDSTPPVEVLPPTGVRTAPACGEKAVLTSDTLAGSTALAVDHPSFPVGKTLSLLLREVDGAGQPSNPDSEEIVGGTVSPSSDTLLALSAPTARDHFAGEEVRWRSSGWSGYWSGWTASPRSSGDTVLRIIPPVIGPVPTPPFELIIEGVEDPIDVIAVSGFDLTLDSPLPGDLSSLSRLEVAPSGGGCAGPGHTGAWDSADAATPQRVAAPTWADGSDSGIRILGIGPAAETQTFYVDVPAPGAGVFVDVPALAPMDAVTRPPASVYNTGDSSDTIDVDVVDGLGRSFGSYTRTGLSPGASENVVLGGITPVGDPIPHGLALDWTAASTNDPGVVDQATTRIDWDFPVVPGFVDVGASGWQSTLLPDPSVFGDWPGAALGGHMRLDAASSVHTISPIDDWDAIDVFMPTLADFLAPLIPGSPSTVPACGPLGFSVQGPFGDEDIHLQTALIVEVEPENGFRPPHDALRGSINPPVTTAGDLRMRIECAESASFHRLYLDDFERERDQRYAFTAEAEVVTQVLRIPDGSLAQQLAFAKEFRALSCVGGFFPHCAAEVPGLAALRIDLLQSSFTGCPSSDCDAFAIPWANVADFDLTLTAPVGSTVRLLDADLQLVANALPEGLVEVAGLDMQSVGKGSSFGPRSFEALPGQIASHVAPTSGRRDRVALADDDGAFEQAAQPEGPLAPWPGPSPAILDPVATVRERFAIVVQGLEPGLYVLQVDAPESFVPSEDPEALGLVWPTDDADGDRFSDGEDNCPAEANDQKDTGGIGPVSSPDGIGDACQCGDVDGDGLVTGLDGTLARRASLDLPPFPGGVTALPGSRKCDIDGVPGCGLEDGKIMQEASLGLSQGIPQTCPAAGSLGDDE